MRGKEIKVRYIGRGRRDWETVGEKEYARGIGRGKSGEDIRRVITNCETVGEGKKRRKQWKRKREGKQLKRKREGETVGEGKGRKR